MNERDAPLSHVVADHIRAWASEQSEWDVGTVLADLRALSDDDERLLAQVALDTVPDGWAKVGGQWVRLVKHDASDGDLISDYFTVED